MDIYRIVDVSLRRKAAPYLDFLGRHKCQKEVEKKTKHVRESMQVFTFL